MMRSKQMILAERRPVLLRSGYVADAGMPLKKKENQHPPVGSLIVFSLLVITLFFGGATLWSIYAPLATAAVAQGTVKVKGNMRMVQHLEGGIVASIEVDEGAVVAADQVLLTLHDASSHALHNSKIAEYVTLKVQEARRLAELSGAPNMRYPADLEDYRNDARFADIFADQEALFLKRQNVQRTKVDMLNQRIEQLKARIAGVRDQIKADKTQMAFVNEEAKDIQTLYDKGLVRKSRLMQMKRTQAFLSGRTGEYEARIAESREKISEVEFERINTNDRFVEQVSTDLETTRAKLSEVQETLSAVEERLQRLDVRAPIAGKVQGLKFHSAGAVVAAGEEILGLVPVDEPMIVEARANPLDIDILRPGLPAKVQLTAYRRRTTPPVNGLLVDVSGDLILDERDVKPHYKITVRIPDEELAGLKDVSLYPGMPADVMVITGERTLFDYIISPILQTLDYAMTEH